VEEDSRKAIQLDSSSVKVFVANFPWDFVVPFAGVG